MALYPLASECGAQVRFAAAGQAEAKQVVTAADKLAVEQARDLAAHLVGQLGLIERGERLARWQAGVLELTLDAPTQAFVGL